MNESAPSPVVDFSVAELDVVERDRNLDLLDQAKALVSFLAGRRLITKGAGASASAWSSNNNTSCGSDTSVDVSLREKG